MVSVSERETGFIEDLTMGKELSEMTLEELWDLFPIFPEFGSEVVQ